MPPLPFSSSGGVVVVVSVGVVVVSEVVVVSVGVVVVVSVVEPVVVSVVELASLGVVVIVAVELVPESPLLAITTTATTKPTITAIRPATSKRVLPCGRCSSS